MYMLWKLVYNHPILGHVRMFSKKIQIIKLMYFINVHFYCIVKHDYA